LVIEPVVDNLRQELQSISNGTKTKFLGRFATIHSKWHMDEMMTGSGTFRGSAIGFLSFHHEVLTVYISKFDTSLTAGPMANTSPPYRPVIDSISKSVQFSNALEGWHNLVHRNTRKYGRNFSDPKKNIYMKRFWQFHKFIDDKFQSWLFNNQVTYDDMDHTLV
jgi:hypothetical protein